MGIFNSTFRQHIIDELNFRKSREARQQVYHPTARVTALVEGNLRGEQLKGFTLGIPDTNLVKSLDQMTNIDGRGSVVGITYNESTPREVRVDSKINLPSPGVTNITISTQSKGGLVFKATVNFKFYGKEQYDFIYQTFMRPGNPILIEYGHTRTAESVSNFNDLGFFKNLDDTTPFENDIKQVSRLPAGRSDGRVAGLVSNFKISLNENNEYEGSIDIINALEYLFTLPPEDTALNYKYSNLSNSIKNNFGILAEDEEYNPAWDRVFQSVVRDLSGDTETYKRQILAPNDIDLDLTRPQRLISDLPGRDNFLTGSPAFFTELGIRTAVAGTRAIRQLPGLDNFGTAGSQQELTDAIETRDIINNPQDYPDYTYVSLYYVMRTLIPRILKTTVTTTTDCNALKTREKLGTQIFQDRRRQRNIKVGGTARDLERIRLEFQEDFNIQEAFEETNIRFELVGYWPLLRSTNNQEVIINNSILYGEGKQTLKDARLESYSQKFDVNQGDVKDSWFRTIDSWSTKELYQPLGELENRTTVRGIYVNYELVRKSFLQANSLSESIVRILNIVNRATNNVLNLKLKMISSDVVTGDGDTFAEEFSLRIYDENVLPTKDEVVDIYKFFEDDISETISYDFDFSLPSAVASTILANSFTGARDDAVGNAFSEQLIYNGYNDSITSMVPPLKREQENTDELLPHCSPSSVDDRADESNEEVDLEEKLRRQLGVLFSSIVGYRELTPPSMKSQIIQSGLFNTLPTSAKISIKLNGLDGFRFGDMFTVRNMLPSPYDENNIFMLTGYKHDISSDNWMTTIDGIMIASTPEEKRPPQSSENVGTALLPGVTPDFEPFLPVEKDLSTLSSTLRKIVEEVKTRLPTTGFGVDGSLGLEMVVISARRSPQENARVGGSQNSRHLTGHAVDIQLFEKTLLPTASYRVLKKPQFIRPSNGYQTRQKTAYVAVAQIFKQVASKRGVNLRWGALESWGGDFSTLQDPNHFDIPTPLP